jgi:hypothetical protein
MPVDVPSRLRARLLVLDPSVAHDPSRIGPERPVPADVELVRETMSLDPRG